SEIKARKLMYEHDAQGFEVEPIVRRWALEQTRQLQYRAPQRWILEEQPWGEGDVRDTQRRVDPQFHRIEMEKHEAQGSLRVLTLVIFVIGRHERELSRHVSTC